MEDVQLPAARRQHAVEREAAPRGGPLPRVEEAALVVLQRLDDGRVPIESLLLPGRADAADDLNNNNNKAWMEEGWMMGLVGVPRSAEAQTRSAAQRRRYAEEWEWESECVGNEFVEE